MLRQPQRVLVIEPEPAASWEFEQALGRLGVPAHFAPDAQAGWREFAAHRPSLLITALRTPAQDGPWLIRRIQNEYVGTMPQMYFLCNPDDIGPELLELEPDGIIVPPLSLATLASMAGAVAEIGDTTARQALRLRELYELSSLGADHLPALDTLVARTALTFGVSDCILWGPAHEAHWPRTARKLQSSEQEATLLWRCDLALTCGSTLLMSRDHLERGTMIIDAPGRSYLAAPIELPGGTELGALCLVDDNSHRFSNDERDALRVLAKRLSNEMSWVAAHTRLIEEHEKLRESSLLDPLLGVWTRTALESSLLTEIARAKGRNETLCVAIVDVDQLRQINDRYGHVAGDEALAHLAQVVRDATRSQDIIGRFGGDEISIVMTQTDLETAEKLLEELVSTVRESPLAHHGLPIGIGIAAGLTLVDDDEDTGDPAFARAIVALRRARRTRAPVVTIDPQRQSRSELQAVDADMADVGVLPPGSTLGGMYRILHEISRGAMGVVYRGEDLGLARPVAIKVLRSDLAQDDDLVGKFRDEAAMLASLHHPNLVQVYSFGTQGDDVYFVMELVEGEPTSELLRAARAHSDGLELRFTAKAITEVAGALSAMHAVGLIHRDVKPANILVDRVRERAVLVDVGVAKRHDDAPDAAGTPGFAAPESFMDSDETAATDVYGLASTTYVLLTGLAPFGSGEVEKVVRRQLYDPPAPPSQLRPDVPGAVDGVLLRALKPNQNERYSTAHEFATALADAILEDAAEHTREDNLSVARNEPPGSAGVNRTASRPPERMPLTTRRTAIPLHAVGEGQGQSRGALFRVAYRIFGNRLGADWVSKLTQSNPALGEVLDPSLSPMSWQPIAHMVTLLRESESSVREPRTFAMAIGRATMTATFARFFGADPSNLATAKVLRATEKFWSRYHTWGRVSVESIGPNTCTLVVHECPGLVLLCALLEGSFARIAELSGATDVATEHTQCVADGHGACKFVIGWSDDRTGPGMIHTSP